MVVSALYFSEIGARGRDEGGGSAIDSTILNHHTVKTMWARGRWNGRRRIWSNLAC